MYSFIVQDSSCTVIQFYSTEHLYKCIVVQLYSKKLYDRQDLSSSASCLIRASGQEWRQGEQALKMVQWRVGQGQLILSWVTPSVMTTLLPYVQLFLSKSKAKKLATPK